MKTNQTALNRILLVISLVSVACLFNLFIIVNPGYFSHDELGFGFHSQGLGDRSLAEMPWHSIFNFSLPQYRPLTFNIWLLISHYFFGYPPIFHFIVLLISFLCGGIAAYIIWEISQNQLFTISFFLIFTISPTTVFTSGWVGTIGESLWVIFSLLILLIALKTEKLKNQTKSKVKQIFNFSIIGILYICALMSKETAIVLPLLLATYFMFFNRAKIYLWLSLSTLTIAIAYLVVRYQYLLGSKQPSAYATAFDFSQLLKHLGGYWMYPFALGRFFDRPNAIYALLIHLLVLALLWWCFSIKKAKAYVISYTLPIAPLLLISMWVPHYLFASGFFLALAIAAIFTFGKRVPRLVAIILTSVLFVHSWNIQLEYYHRGVIQQRINDTMYVQLRDYMTSNQLTDVPEVFISIDSDSPSSDILVRSIHTDVFNNNDLLIQNRLHFIGKGKSKINNNNNTLFLRFSKKGYLLEREFPSKYRLGDEITMQNGNLASYAGSGWSIPEPQGIWSDGTESNLFMKLEKLDCQSLILQVQANPFIPKGVSEQVVDVLANDNLVGQWKFNDYKSTKHEAIIPCNIIRNNLLTISFRFAKPTSPFSLGISSDKRLLGFQLQAIKVSQDKS